MWKLILLDETEPKNASKREFELALLQSFSASHKTDTNFTGRLIMQRTNGEERWNKTDYFEKACTRSTNRFLCVLSNSWHTWLSNVTGSRQSNLPGRLQFTNRLNWRTAVVENTRSYAGGTKRREQMLYVRSLIQQLISTYLEIIYRQESFATVFNVLVAPPLQKDKFVFATKYEVPANPYDLLLLSFL